MSDALNTFFVLDPGGESRGPYNLEQLRHMVRLGAVGRHTLYTQPGFEEWFELSMLAEAFENAPVEAELHFAQPPKEAKWRSAADGILRPVLFVASMVIAVIGFYSFGFWGGLVGLFFALFAIIGKGFSTARR